MKIGDGIGLTQAYLHLPYYLVSIYAMPMLSFEHTASGIVCETVFTS